MSTKETEKPKPKGFRAWLCKTFGHSFKNVDLLMFNIEIEGRCFWVDSVTGERLPRNHDPIITCRRCGQSFTNPSPAAGKI